jgi:hypothetical protein
MDIKPMIKHGVVALLFLAATLPAVHAQRVITANDLKAINRFQVGTDNSMYVDGFDQVIDSVSTHRKLPTAKSVYDYLKNFSGIVSGDVSGTVPGTLQVVGLRGRNISTATPVAGDVLVLESNRWTPKAKSLLDTQSLDISTGLLRISRGNSVAVDVNPADDITNQTNLGGDVVGNLPDDTEVVGIWGRPILDTVPTTGQVLKYNGTAWLPATDNLTASSLPTYTNNAAAIADGRVAGDLYVVAAGSDTDPPGTIKRVY